MNGTRAGDVVPPSCNRKGKSTPVLPGALAQVPAWPQTAHVASEGWVWT